VSARKQKKKKEDAAAAASKKVPVKRNSLEPSFGDIEVGAGADGRLSAGLSVDMGEYLDRGTGL
jgi:hypothetical protein